MRVTLFWYMVVFSVALISRILLGLHMAQPASGPGSQVPSSAFAEGPAKLETVTRRATKVEAEERRAAGRRFWPRSVTPSRGRDTKRQTPLWTEVIVSLLGCKCSPKARLIPVGESSPKGRSFATAVAVVAAQGRHAKSV